MSFLDYLIVSLLIVLTLALIVSLAICAPAVLLSVSIFFLLLFSHRDIRARVYQLLSE